MGGMGLGQEEAEALGLDQHVAWGAGGVRQSGGVHGFAGDLPPPSSAEATSRPQGGGPSFTDGLPPPCEHYPAAYGWSAGFLATCTTLSATDCAVPGLG